MLEARKEAEELYERVLSLESLERGPKWEMLLRTSIDEIGDALRQSVYRIECLEALAEIVSIKDKLLPNDVKKSIGGFLSVLDVLREHPTLAAMTEELSEVDIVKLLVEGSKHGRDLMIAAESAHETTMEILKTLLVDIGEPTIFDHIEFLTTEHPEMVCHVREVWSDEDIPRTMSLLSCLHTWLKEVGETDVNPSDLAEDFIDGLAIYDTLEEDDVPWGKVKRDLRL